MVQNQQAAAGARRPRLPAAATAADAAEGDDDVVEGEIVEEGGAIVMLTQTWDPFRDVSDPSRSAFDRMVGQTSSRRNAWVPALDVHETEDQLRRDRRPAGPGAGPGRGHVRGRDCSRSADTREFSTEEDEGALPPDRAQLRLVRAVGHAARAPPTPSKIEAAFDKGVLTVEVPKREEAKPKTIEVKAK